VSQGEPLAGQTVDAARRTLTARFKSSSIESAELDARMLVGAALGLDLTGLISAAGRRLTADESIRLGEFWGLPLTLSAATLVPRPDTETVVELALDMLRACPASDRPLRIADLGTGSGAILLALLSELSGAVGTGTDISVAALATARGNAIQLGLADRAEFIACDYAADLSGPFDLIVSNPPYIRSADIAGLATEVRNFDPLGALDGGRDGLDAYRALIPQAARLLAPQGVLVVEVGQGQHDDVTGLMIAAGLAPEGPAKADLAGIRRAVAGRKKPS